MLEAKLSPSLTVFGAFTSTFRNVIPSLRWMGSRWLLIIASVHILYLTLSFGTAYGRYLLSLFRSFVLAPEFSSLVVDAISAQQLILGGLVNLAGYVALLYLSAPLHIKFMLLSSGVDDQRSFQEVFISDGLGYLGRYIVFQLFVLLFVAMLTILGMFVTFIVAGLSLGVFGLILSLAVMLFAGFVTLLGLILLRSRLYVFALRKFIRPGAGDIIRLNLRERRIGAVLALLLMTVVVTGIATVYFMLVSAIETPVSLALLNKDIITDLALSDPQSGLTNFSNFALGILVVRLVLAPLTVTAFILSVSLENSFFGLLYHQLSRSGA